MLDWLLSLINKRQKALYEENKKLRGYRDSWDKLATAAVASQAAFERLTNRVERTAALSEADLKATKELSASLKRRVDHAIYIQLEAEKK